MIGFVLLLLTYSAAYAQSENVEKNPTSAVPTGVSSVCYMKFDNSLDVMRATSQPIVLNTKWGREYFSGVLSMRVNLAKMDPHFANENTIVVAIKATNCQVADSADPEVPASA
jgi:hypothetical protein